VALCDVCLNGAVGYFDAGALLILANHRETNAEAGVRELFNYCGRPLESELRHEETGFFLYADGRRAAPVLLLRQDHAKSKGRLLFCCEVVPGDSTSPPASSSVPAASIQTVKWISSSFGQHHRDNDYRPASFHLRPRTHASICSIRRELRAVTGVMRPVRA
jgi:hypothetical protein